MLSCYILYPTFVPFHMVKYHWYSQLCPHFLYTFAEIICDMSHPCGSNLLCIYITYMDALCIFEEMKITFILCELKKSVAYFLLIIGGFSQQVSPMLNPN